MRPVNLIPEEQRKGRGLGAGAGGSGVAVYVLLGVLAAAVLAVAAVVLTSNKINDRENDLTALEQEEKQATAAAASLRPYGDFVKLANDRQQTVSALAQSRFNWERVLRQLSRTIPSNAWLTSFAGSVTADSSGGGEGGGGVSSLRGEASGPAISLEGCTYSQSDVARMMVRMRNIDGVTAVILEESGLQDETEDSSGSAGLGGGGEASGEDCSTDKIPKFTILIAFGGVALPGSSGGAATGIPEVAKAEAAAEAGGSSSSTGGGP